MMLQTLYMYNISQELACLIVTVMIIPLGQVRANSAVAYIQYCMTNGQYMSS